MTTYNPTPEQCARAARVQQVLLAEINLLAREGVSPPEMLAGIGSAVADVLTTVWGPASVGPWFSRQAKLIEELQGPSH